MKMERWYIRKFQVCHVFDETYDTESDYFGYNKYGVAEGEWCLIDKNGHEIPDTQLNCVDNCHPDNRYYMFCMLTVEQEESIKLCGTAPGIKMNVYDTKHRKYVIKGIPEGKLNIWFDGDEEVVKAAAELCDQYNHVTVEENGMIVAKSGKRVDVFDYDQVVT